MKSLETIVEIFWRDASTIGGWQDKESYEKHDIVECRTVGFFLKKTKNSITVVTTFVPGFHDCNQSISIPLSWCSKIKVLRK